MQKYDKSDRNATVRETINNNGFLKKNLLLVAYS